MEVLILCKRIAFALFIYACVIGRTFRYFHSMEEINGLTDIALITRSSGTTGMPKGKIVWEHFLSGNLSTANIELF